jgi:type IV secretory pathway ATPase VirB11/archaellum biosynthesis ATPase
MLEILNSIKKCNSEANLLTRFKRSDLALSLKKDPYSFSYTYKHKGGVEQSLKDYPAWLEQVSTSSQVENIVKLTWQILIGKKRFGLSPLGIKNYLFFRLFRRKFSEEQLSESVKSAVRSLAEKSRISPYEIEQAEQELFNLIFGQGPISPLIKDPLVSDIFIDSFDRICCLRRRESIVTPFKFRSPETYNYFLVNRLGFNEESIKAAPLIKNPLMTKPLEVSTDAYFLMNPIGFSKLPKVHLKLNRLERCTFVDLLKNRVLPPSVALWLAELLFSRGGSVLVVGPYAEDNKLLLTALLNSINVEERLLLIGDEEKLLPINSNLHIDFVSSDLLRLNSSSLNYGVDGLIDLIIKKQPHRLVLDELSSRAHAYAFLQLVQRNGIKGVATLLGCQISDALFFLLESYPYESALRQIIDSVDIVLLLGHHDGSLVLKEVAEVRKVKAVTTGRSTPPEINTLVRFIENSTKKRFWKLCLRESYWLNRIGERGVELSNDELLLD